MAALSSISWGVSSRLGSGRFNENGLNFGTGEVVASARLVMSGTAARCGDAASSSDLLPGFDSAGADADVITENIWRDRILFSPVSVALEGCRRVQKFMTERTRRPWFSGAVGDADFINHECQGCPDSSRTSARSRSWLRRRNGRTVSPRFTSGSIAAAIASISSSTGMRFRGITQQRFSCHDSFGQVTVTLFRVLLVVEMVV